MYSMCIKFELGTVRHPWHQSTAKRSPLFMQYIKCMYMVYNYSTNAWHTSAALDSKHECHELWAAQWYVCFHGFPKYSNPDKQSLWFFETNLHCCFFRLLFGCLTSLKTKSTGSRLSQQTRVTSPLHLLNTSNNKISFTFLARFTGRAQFHPAESLGGARPTLQFGQLTAVPLASTLLFTCIVQSFNLTHNISLQDHHIVYYVGRMQE